MLADVEVYDRVLCTRMHVSVIYVLCTPVLTDVEDHTLFLAGCDDGPPDDEHPEDKGRERDKGLCAEFRVEKFRVRASVLDFKNKAGEQDTASRAAR